MPLYILRRTRWQVPVAGLAVACLTTVAGAVTAGRVVEGAAAELPWLRDPARLVHTDWRAELAPALSRLPELRIDRTVTAPLRGRVLADTLTLPAHVVVSADTTILARQVVFAGRDVRISTSGNDISLLPIEGLRTMQPGGSITIDSSQDTSGESGAQGEPGANGANEGEDGAEGWPGNDTSAETEELCADSGDYTGGPGEDGGDGDDGGTGGTGGKGGNAGDITVDLAVEPALATGTGGARADEETITLTASGGTGGTGGHGGDGRNGGYGGDGGPGGTCTFYDGTLVGDAGDGGTGGTGGDGGKGGTGGHGGDGGTITAIYHPDDIDDSQLLMDAAAGEGGEGGDPGELGLGGGGGIGGSPPLRGLDGQPGSKGRKGQPGKAGKAPRYPYGALSTTGSNAVALTFDDGPSTPYTGQILGLLKQHNVKATFCVVGNQARAHPDLVARIAAEGHSLCNHSNGHELALGRSDKETIRANLEATNQAIRAAVPNARIAYFRQPGGNWTPSVVEVAESMGMRGLHWITDPRDYERPGASVIVSRVLDGGQRGKIVFRKVESGAIVLMHDGGGDRSQTVQALGTLLPTLKQRFQLVAL